MSHESTSPGQDPQQPIEDTSSTTQPEASQPRELSDDDLDKVSGGAMRRGGDDDLDDLEVER